MGSAEQICVIYCLGVLFLFLFASWLFYTERPGAFYYRLEARLGSRIVQPFGLFTTCVRRKNRKFTFVYLRGYDLVEIDKDLYSFDDFVAMIKEENTTD